MSGAYWTADSAVITADSTLVTADSGPFTAATAEFVHAGGSRTLAHARMPPLTRYYALASEPTSGLAFMRGDGLPHPGPLALTATVTAASGRLRDAYALAYAIAEEASTATSVTLHFGTFTTDGVLGYSMRSEENTVQLTLEFAPTSAGSVTA